ncbi:MAG: ribosome small subunit-dependent GTPase A [Planctomycetaceae bacterium]|nr:ribosome small subunit-dependent GTPase A [Planctomycetaceae bacterium]
MGAKKKSRKKLRVRFHKNREAKARIQNLTRKVADDLEDAELLTGQERLSGKGETAKYRTVIGEVDEASGETVLMVDLQTCEAGRVLSSIGANHCQVQTATGGLLQCSVRRVVRTLSRDSRNVVVAGDQVLYSRTDESSGVIERVEPRRTALSRGSRRRAHIIVANVDQAVIVASAAEPALKPALIDRFLCSTEKGGIQGIVCINKLDLANRVELQPLLGQYARLNYPVLLTNAISGEGIDELRRLLRNKETVFTGQSGVGKTSLLNAIQPGLGRRTAEVSEDSQKGRHTTRVTELIALEQGGWVVDTPGIRQLQLWDVQTEEVEGLFVEFRPFVALCHFPDCSHTHEQNCGVKQGVDLGMISPLRYESYLRITQGDEESLFSLADWRRR